MKLVTLSFLTLLTLGNCGNNKNGKKKSLDSLGTIDSIREVNEDSISNNLTIIHYNKFNKYKVLLKGDFIRKSLSYRRFVFNHVLGNRTHGLLSNISKFCNVPIDTLINILIDYHKLTPEYKTQYPDRLELYAYDKIVEDLSNKHPKFKSKITALIWYYEKFNSSELDEKNDNLVAENEELTNY